MIEGRTHALARVGDDVAIEQFDSEAGAGRLSKACEHALGIGPRVCDGVEFVETSDRVGVDSAQPRLAAKPWNRLNCGVRITSYIPIERGMSLELGIERNAAWACHDQFRGASVD